MTARQMALGVLVVLGLLSGAARAGELAAAEDAVVKVAAAARPCVVTVLTPDPKDFDATGVVIAPGVVLTVRAAVLHNGVVPEHVVIRVPGRKATIDAELLDHDGDTDTALYRAPGAGRALGAGRAEDVHHGMWVLLVGNAFGQGRESTPTLSLGVVSAIASDAFHTSALVNPGSFGAPVVDLSGDLIGIAAATVTPDGQQTVVVPFDRIREAYRKKGGRGASAVGREPPPRRPRNHIADLMGPVLEDAAAKGAQALVAVRALPLPGDEKPAEEPKEGERRAAPPPPRRVPGERPGFDRASGLIVGSTGLVLCPLRVTGWPGPRRSLEVDVYGGGTYPAEVLGQDERMRLALLKIPVGALPVLAPAPPESLRAGTLVVALGYPHAQPKATPQLTFGVLSRTEALGQLHPAFRALQTDAGVSLSNRGGPLVDVDGRLLGIVLDLNDADIMGYVTRASGRYADNAGLGFAVPWSVLAPLVPRLERGDVLKPGYLGVRTVDTPDGLEVVEVLEKNSKEQETAAKAAGLAKGDLILALGGEDVRTGAGLRQVLGRYAQGDRVQVAFRRGEERREVEVTLGEP